MTQVRNGSCLCGKISYRVTGAISSVSACHCSQCRKQSGHYYAATRAKQQQFEIDDPDGLIKWYRASKDAARGFCSNCGSALFWKDDNSDYLSVLAGSIDGDSGLKIGEHIFTADKGDYYDIDENEPQFPGDRNLR